jgi:hypothetical protein
MSHQPQPGDVLIAFTNGAYNDGRRAINLRIEDETSGKFLIDVDLTGPEWTAFVGTRHVRKSGYLLQLHYLLVGETLAAHLEIHETNPVAPYFEVDIDGESFAAILGNAVTRVSGARILKESR